MRWTFFIIRPVNHRVWKIPFSTYSITIMMITLMYEHIYTKHAKILICIHIIQFHRHRYILYNDILQFICIEQVTLILKIGAWRSKLLNIERYASFLFLVFTVYLNEVSTVFAWFFIISTSSHDIAYNFFERYIPVASYSYV